jgi:hypothetical protein
MNGGHVAPFRSLNPVNMAQITVWLDYIAHTCFQGFGIGKPAIAFAFPDQDVVAMNFKNATQIIWYQSNTSQIIAKSRQKLLRQPSRPQEPIASGAIGDSD